MRAPVDTLRSVYGALGIAWPASYGDGGGRAPGRPPEGGRGPHEYSLEALGLDPAASGSGSAATRQHFQVPDEISRPQRPADDPPLPAVALPRGAGDGGPAERVGPHLDVGEPGGLQTGPAAMSGSTGL